MRGNEKPFGGIQLILTGDFLQLPPVTRSDQDRRYIRMVHTTSSISHNCAIRYRYGILKNLKYNLRMCSKIVCVGILVHAGYPAEGNAIMPCTGAGYRAVYPVWPDTGTEYPAIFIHLH